jgi:hypothetical protein
VVTPSVVGMEYQPLAYDDADQAAVMHRDCDRARMRLGRPTRPSIAERAVGPAPSIRFEDNDREVPKREIRVSEAAARLAAALHLG